MKVSLVRHTSVAIDGNLVCYGYSDVSVSDNFREEAERLKGNIAHLTPNAVFSSPLRRARMLADYCGFSPIVEDHRIKEMNFGEWEMRAWETILSTDDIPAFFAHYVHNAVPGGESLKDQSNRVKAFLDEQKQRGYEHILVFCHGGVINCARSIVDGYPLDEAFAYLPPFASHTLLHY